MDAFYIIYVISLTSGVFPTLIMLFWISAAVASMILSEFSLSKYLEYHKDKQNLLINTVSP